MVKIMSDKLIILLTLTDTGKRKLSITVASLRMIFDEHRLLLSPHGVFTIDVKVIFIV